MSYRHLAEALLQNRPYFGMALRSLQGDPDRQKYFRPVVQVLSKARNVQILEVGSWAGASAVSWATALNDLGLSGQVTCVDAWRPYFDLEKNATGHYQRMNDVAENGSIYKLFQHNISCSGFAGTIVAKSGTSREILPTLASRSFDAIYLDGSHMLDDVVFDLSEAKRLIRLGGIICGDDLELQLKDMDPAEALAAARTGQDFVTSTRGPSYHPGVTVGVAQEVGEVGMWNGFWAIRFSGKEWEQVQLDASRSEIPRHLLLDAIKVELDMGKHYLISSRGRYFALAKELGPPDIAAEQLAEEDVPPLVFSGDTLGVVQRKLQEYYDGEAG